MLQKSTNKITDRIKSIYISLIDFTLSFISFAVFNSYFLQIFVLFSQYSLSVSIFRLFNHFLFIFTSQINLSQLYFYTIVESTLTVVCMWSWSLLIKRNEPSCITNLALIFILCYWQYCVDAENFTLCECIFWKVNCLNISKNIVLFHVVYHNKL